MQFSAKLTGADKVQLGIRSLGKALPNVDNDDVEKAMQRAAKVSVPYVGGNEYAVPLPNSGFNGRTGNLGRSVIVYQQGPSHKIKVEAYSRGGFDYTTLVIGDRDGTGQAETNQQRWVTMKDAVDYQLDDLVQTLDKDNQALIDEKVG
jgi:hypothetical protein